MLSKCAFISFANDRGNYLKGLQRLEDSLKQVESKAAFFGYRGEESIKAPLHIENPYAFKLYCFSKTRANHFKKIIYLDSSVYAISNPDHLFDHLDKYGYLMQEAGYYVRDWCNEYTKKEMGLTQKELDTFLMYGNAGMLGLNFDFPIAEQFFFQWWNAMYRGLFKGDWADHRHDMTLGSIIANRTGMKYIPGDQVLQYAKPEDPLNNDTVVFKACGI